jgi:anti-sigma factor RsiW
MMHWLHIFTRRVRMLAAYAAGELPESKRSRVEAALATCAGCRREVEAFRLVSSTLRASGRIALDAREAAAFWPAVERRICPGADVAQRRRAYPSLRELFWDHPRLSLASAAAAVVLALGLTLGQSGLWSARPPAVPNGVEVVSVEAGGETSVMVFQAPGSSIKVIWVFMKPSW